ncbi:tRNA-dihydrouridine(20) synthase [NAD(P)+]-like [Sesamum alatum]|uniref:tRNA-dihydrouridine(20) synthase [NAD(P)+]-like n=1 Tax=Sesamum alatum TaxID=300844 RepID=A0AAE1XQX8_9LAMI|nr:tRNA-dihydrouridine(20) synthase [NAD(P)+]-like [Sesamum alatum]
MRVTMDLMRGWQVASGKWTLMMMDGPYHRNRVSINTRVRVHRPDLTTLWPWLLRCPGARTDHDRVKLLVGIWRAARRETGKLWPQCSVSAIAGMEIDYTNKLVLAPMVRVGTLPFRLLAAEYGADITYGEEIIDHKILKCERRINDVLGTIDVVEKGTDSVVFRTCSEERNRVVFQMGTSDAVRALRAAQILCKDVAAVDINMGCPKSFSISGGMGAALLTKPDLIHDILTTLKRNLNTPVTCKIRLLKSPQDTVELARRIEKTGVSALAVHGRKVADRPRDPAKWSEIADVVAAVSIPVIANGDVFEYEDFERIKVATGASSVMVARGALWNASMFSPKGKLPWEDVKREYVRKSILWDNDIKSTKHTLKEMIMHYSCLEFPEGKAVIKSETLADLARHYGEDNYYELINKSRFSFGGSR